MSDLPPPPPELWSGVDLDVAVASASMLPKRGKGKALPPPIPPVDDYTPIAIPRIPRRRSSSFTNESPSPIAHVLPPPVEFGGPVINAVVNMVTSPKPKKNKPPPPCPIDHVAAPDLGYVGDDVIDLAKVDAEIEERIRGLAELQALRHAAVAQQVHSPRPRPRRISTDSEGSDLGGTQASNLHRQNTQDSGRGSGKSIASTASCQSERRHSEGDTYDNIPLHHEESDDNDSKSILASKQSVPPQMPHLSPPERIGSLARTPAIPIWDPNMGPPPPPPDDPPPIAPPRRSKTRRSFDRDISSLNAIEEAKEANRLSQLSQDGAQEDNGPVYEDIDDVVAEMRSLQSKNNLEVLPAALNNGNETFEIQQDALQSGRRCTWTAHEMKRSDQGGRGRGRLKAFKTSSGDNRRLPPPLRSESDNGQEEETFQQIPTRRSRSNSLGTRGFFGRRKSASDIYSGDPPYSVATPK